MFSLTCYCGPRCRNLAAIHHDGSPSPGDYENVAAKAPRRQDTKDFLEGQGLACPIRILLRIRRGLQRALTVPCAAVRSAFFNTFSVVQHAETIVPRAAGEAVTGFVFCAYLHSLWENRMMNDERRIRNLKQKKISVLTNNAPHYIINTR